MSAEEGALELAGRVKKARLEKRLTQIGLSRRSGVALGSLKKFESSGQISLVSFIRLITALEAEKAFEAVLKNDGPTTMDDLLERSVIAKRGRIR